MEFNTHSFLGIRPWEKNKLFTSIKHALETPKTMLKQKHVICIDHDAIELITNQASSSILL